MDVRNLSGKTVVVTGAASGIGRATALAFARRGADLAICDLNQQGLEETESEIRRLGRNVIQARVDVADPAQMEAFADRVHQKVEAVDILMNNAGVAVGGGFLYTTLEDWEWILGVNVRGVVHGCHFFVPRMVEAGPGRHVINVASSAGHVATETLAAYGTTKFAVVGLSEALREELSRYGIGVTAVCPGIINTPITHAARLRGPEATPQARERMIDMYQRRNYPPERVAEKVLNAVQRNRAVAPVSPEAWAMYLMKRFVPGLVERLKLRLSERMRRELARS
jgi:NAD(P)-dependent dehydrogenase (short-subunit alcohol dehydrogenase family)